MVLERYRTGWDNGLGPIASGMHRIGLTPNMLTVISFIFALLAAGAFILADASRAWLLFLGSVFVAINAILDGLDGKLARITKTANPRGDYLDHVIDRYSDVAILAGLALSPFGDLRWGILAIVGTFMTSYMGTQAQALGLGRNYAGWLGRADRLVLLIAFPIFTYGAHLFGITIPGVPVTLVTVMLIYFGVVGNVTALQRFWSGWKQLDDKPS